VPLSRRAYPDYLSVPIDGACATQLLIWPVGIDFARGHRVSAHGPTGHDVARPSRCRDTATRSGNTCRTRLHGFDTIPAASHGLQAGGKAQDVFEEIEMRGAGFLAIWSDIEAGTLTDYRHWLTREHTTERVTTKGFLAVRVFRADRADVDRFFILYELEAPEVLDGPAYMARLNAPTPWSQRIMPQLGNFIRGGGVMSGRAGRGEGSTIAALRLEQLPEAPQQLADALAALDGIAAVQVGVTDQARTQVPTKEKGMRQQEGFFAGLLIVEALDDASLRCALRAAAEIAPQSIPGGEPEIYRGIFALDARIADFG
jgi:hypothetical protein